MKILVTGNAGSGKSTLGKELSHKLGIPYHGLDKIVWRENWQPTPRDERQKLIKEITNQENWLIEGVSKLALEKADKGYFLDIPLHRCLLNIIKRFVKNGIGTREGLPTNCPEFIGVLKAVKIAFVFRRSTRPWLLEEVATGKLTRITKYKDLTDITLGCRNV